MDWDVYSIRGFKPLHHIYCNTAEAYPFDGLICMHWESEGEGYWIPQMIPEETVNAFSSNVNRVGCFPRKAKES